LKLKKAMIETGVYEYFLEISKKIPAKDVRELFKIESYRKGDIINFIEDPEENGLVWSIISGNAKQIFYPNDCTEYVVISEKGQWLGAPAIILGVHTVMDVEFLEDTEILVFPLGKIMKERDDIMKELWEKIARDACDFFLRITFLSMARSAMTNEKNFTKYLIDHNFSIKGISTKIISEILGINLRTLQRIISKLEKRRLINRERKLNHIWINDIDVFKKYHQSLEN